LTKIKGFAILKHKRRVSKIANLMIFENGRSIGELLK